MSGKKRMGKRKVLDTVPISRCERSSKVETKKVCDLPNGSWLYRKENGVGGYIYFSDEVGGGVVVWDTALVASSTLLAALTEEFRRIHEQHNKTRSENAKGGHLKQPCNCSGGRSSASPNSARGKNRKVG